MQQYNQLLLININTKQIIITHFDSFFFFISASFNLRSISASFNLRSISAFFYNKIIELKNKLFSKNTKFNVYVSLNYHF